MSNLLINLAIGMSVTDAMLEEELTNVCENTHASCDETCPVYFLNGFSIPDSANDFNVNRGCDTFKNGKKMLAFIRENK